MSDCRFRELKRSYSEMWSELESSGVGKRVARKIYVHTSALHNKMRRLVECASLVAGINSRDFNMVRFAHPEEAQVALMSYPTFFDDGFPALRASWLVCFDKRTVKHTDYSRHQSPPILHRKETFIASDHPMYEIFAALTQQAEKAGLFARTNRIGSLGAWNKLLESKQLRVEGNTLVVT